MSELQEIKIRKLLSNFLKPIVGDTFHVDVNYLIERIIEILK